MKLAKPRIDYRPVDQQPRTDAAFWQGEVGVPFDHLLTIRRARTSTGTTPWARWSRSTTTPSRCRTVRRPATASCYIAREGLTEPKPMVDPDGNRVTLVPPG